MSVRSSARLELELEAAPVEQSKNISFTDDCANSAYWNKTEESLGVSQDRLRVSELKRQTSLARIIASRDILLKAQQTLFSDTSSNTLIGPKTKNRVDWLAFDPRVEDL